MSELCRCCFRLRSFGVEGCELFDGAHASLNLVLARKQGVFLFDGGGLILCERLFGGHAFALSSLGLFRFAPGLMQHGPGYLSMCLWIQSWHSIDIDSVGGNSLTVR